MNGIRYTFIDVEVPIDKPEPNIVYVCQNDYRVDFICPCGCGEIISLNLYQDLSPKWKVNGTTISPSINRLVGCRSHFNITNGLTHS